MGAGPDGEEAGGSSVASPDLNRGDLSIGGLASSPIVGESLTPSNSKAQGRAMHGQRMVEWLEASGLIYPIDSFFGVGWGWVTKRGVVDGWRSSGGCESWVVSKALTVIVIMHNYYHRSHSTRCLEIYLLFAANCM